MTMIDPAPALRDLCGGAIALPGDDGYDAARQAFNLAVDQRPAAVAYPADEHEVAAIVRAAREHGLRVAPQATGHNAGPLGSLDRSILVKTSGIGGVEIDAVNRIARVGAGVLWEEVVDAAAPYGLIALHGSSPNVSVTGYSLGGGMGWLARSHGLQANSVTAIELVTADGELVRTDAQHDPELFWALRGGGGNFGIVTALEFRLYPLSEVYAGMHAVGLDRGRARAHGLGGVGGRRARPRHHLLPDHAAPAARGASGDAARPQRRDHRRRRPGRPGRARPAARAQPRARPVRHGPGARARAHPPGPGGPDAVRRRHRADRRSSRRRPSRR